MFWNYKGKNGELNELAVAEELIANAFRRWGYLQAHVDPLGELEPFAHRDLDNIPPEEAERWREIYCGKIGAEFMHMPLSERCDWVAERMESKPKPPNPVSYTHLTLPTILLV